MPRDRSRWGQRKRCRDCRCALNDDIRVRGENQCKNCKRAAAKPVGSGIAHNDEMRTHSFAEVLAYLRGIHGSDRAIIEDLIGWYGPLSLTEVGQVLGLSRERVRQLEATALRKLARLARTGGLQCD